MSYSFEDSSSGQPLDSGTVETSAHLQRGGVPRWAMAILGVAALAMVFTARSNLPSDEAVPPTTAPDSVLPATTTTALPATTAPDVLITSPPNQLTHQDLEWPVRNPDGIVRSIAVRQGTTVVVINPATGDAHQIELPATETSELRVTTGRDNRSMALVAGKVIVHDDRFLRSLSTVGGVDVLLSNSSLGFEVTTPTAIVAATEVVSSSALEADIRLVPQGVHFPTGRGQVIGALDEPDPDLLPGGSDVVVVDGKIFVRLNGELHRKTADGLVSIGSRRVFAASENAAIIERCVALFENCSYFHIDLTDLSAPEMPLRVPLSFSSSNIIMDADGSSLIVQDDGSDAQSLVDISTGEWIVTHKFDGERFSAVTYDSVTESWILGYVGSVAFWTPTRQEYWRIATPPEFSEIAEIAIAQRGS